MTFDSCVASSRDSKSRTIFITGTDTGVGKTLLTGLLLSHLLGSGRRALAIKPFCSGNRADVRFLRALQGGQLSLDEVNPFHFEKALAPFVAARNHDRHIKLQEVLAHIRLVIARRLLPTEHSESRTQNPVLLVEGVGGLLVPLGRNYTVLDVIARLACRPARTPRLRCSASRQSLEVIVVSRNRLGTINHTLLTVFALQNAGVQDVKVVLMNLAKTDISGQSNPWILAELLAPTPVLQVPFLGPDALRLDPLKKNAKKIKKMLAQILS